MKASDLFVKALENEGTKYIFGIPGEENLDLLESIRNSKIQLILTRHEQAAGFMAATYGRLTGKPGVCLSTLGPGATNFVTAASYAQLGGMPMIMITGQKPVKKSKQGRFQIVDIVNMMRPLTKFTKQIVNGNTIPSIIREAFKISGEERPGAVHLELPEDIAREKTDQNLFEVHEIRRPSADEKAVLMAAEMIQNSARPLLLIGAGANRKRTSWSLMKFIEKTSIYFFNTQMGKGVIDENHKLFLGTTAISDNDFIHCAIQNADLIINVGHDVIEKPPFFMSENGPKVIHVNFFSADIDDVYFPQLNVVGDIASTINHITSHLKTPMKWDDAYYKNINKKIKDHINSQASMDQFPLLPQRVVAITREVLPNDGIVTLDNGIYKIWFARNFLCTLPNTLLLDNALATMGAGLPQAIAAKIVYPKRKVIAVCGDGGFMMNSQEIETALRLKLDLSVIILNDKSYGMIKWKQKGMDLPEFGLDFNNPDFVKYAESYGAKGHKAGSSKDLKKILLKCLETGGVNLIDMPVDYSQNSKELDEELKALTCNL